MRPHGISHQSFLVYLPNLHVRITFAFWTSLHIDSSSTAHAFVSGFCSSGYDFAIASSRLHLAMQTLQVALGFVDKYAPCGLSPQTNGMPAILQKKRTLSDSLFELVARGGFGLRSASVRA